MKWLMGIILAACTIVQADMSKNLLDQVSGITDVLYHSSKEREKVNFLIEKLGKDHFVETDDRKLQPLFVNLHLVLLRELIELAKEGEVQELSGMIHRPILMAALCEPWREDECLILGSPGLGECLRDFLRVGGTLYSVYPKEGKSVRNDEEVKRYELLCEKQPGLQDHPIEGKLSKDLNGLTYVMKMNGETVVMSLRLPTGVQDGKWQLWLGGDEKSLERLSRVIRFLESVGVNVIESD